MGSGCPLVHGSTAEVAGGRLLQYIGALWGQWLAGALQHTFALKQAVGRYSSVHCSNAWGSGQGARLRKATAQHGAGGSRPF